MIPSIRFSRACDFFGTGALVGAVVVLAGRFFLSNVAEATIFSSFFICLALAVGAYLAARIAQIARVIASNPHPRSRRVLHAAASNFATVQSVQPATKATDLKRAA